MSEPHDYKCRIYIRVSTKIQADKTKSSLKAQLKACRESIEKYGWVEVGDEVYRDKDSGQTYSRKGLEKALFDAEKKEFNLLVVYDYDRLARSAGDCINLVNRDFLHKGVQVYSYSQPFELDPPDKINYYNDARLLNTIFSAFKSSADINKMRQKYNDGMLNKVKHGELPHPATPPYGYQSKATGAKKAGKSVANKINWKVTINKKEAKVVRRIFNDYYRGKSYRLIARELTDGGIPTPRKKTWWNYSTVKLILENPVYAGRVRWQWKRTPVPGQGQKRQPQNKWVITKGNHTPIIEPKKFDAVQRLMKRKAKLPGRFSQGKALLASIIKCSHCGKRMWATSKTKTAQPYYICATWHQFKKCISNFVPMEEADNIVTNRILDLIKDEGKFVRSFEKKIKSDKEEPSDGIKLQGELLADLEKERTRVRTAYRKKALSMKDTRAMLIDIDNETAPILEKIEELKEKESQKKFIADAVRSIKNLGDIKKHFKKSKKELRTALLELLDSVEATKKESGDHSLKIHFQKFN